MTPQKAGNKHAMKDKKNKDVYLQSVTMIDPATGWIEMLSVPEARVDLVANQVDQAQLTRYPLHNKIIVDRGKEFLEEFKAMEFSVIPLAQETLKPMQQQKEYIKQQEMYYILSKSKIWTKKMRTLGKEFSHLLCSPFGLPWILLPSTHNHNWSLVGMRS